MSKAILYIFLVLFIVFVGIAIDLGDNVNKKIRAQ